jgi:arginase
MSDRPWTILGIPIDCSGRAIGVERMPAALRAAGLAARLGARDLGDLSVSIDDSARDPATGIIGFEAVCASSAATRSALRAMLARGERPLLIGGCCTLLIGACAALKDHFGRYGLAFVDGHLDFYDGRTSPTGEAADMDLAILSGFGPPGLVGLAGDPPLVEPADVVVLGYRDGEQAAVDGALDPAVVAPAIQLYDAMALRGAAAARIGGDLATAFAGAPGRFWLHLDLDVLDESVMPAVDYRMPGGLLWDELAELLLPLAGSPALVGADVTIYNPTLDPDGAYARRIVQLLGDVLL